MTRVLTIAVAAALTVVVGGCGSDRDEAAKLSAELKEPLSRAYGPVDSMRCEKNDDVKLLGRRTAYDCIDLASGRVERLCAGFAKGAPLVAAHVPCTASRYARP